MIFRSTALALLGVLLLSFFSLDAQAGPVNPDCADVPLWDATTLYSPGQKVVFQGSLYQVNVQIENVPPNFCSTCNWYTFIELCIPGDNPPPPPPFTTITSPTNGASLSCGVSVSLTATAVDPGATVSKLEYFDGGVSLGTATTAPYTVSWVPSSSGSHQLTATATDSANGKITSSPISVTVGSCSTGNAGALPARVLVGYWHNFDNGSGFIKLRDVSPNWDLIDLAFGEPVAGSTSQIQFVPFTQTSTAELQSDVQILHSRGKKVLLSVGGANGLVQLHNATETQQFVSSVTSIIQLYGLDGLDVDFENQSLQLNAGDSDFTHPTTPTIVNLIAALRQISKNIGPNFILTMAPETFFVQVGYQFYGGTSGGDPRTGAFLPVIDAVRDMLTLLTVQEYNSGPVTGLDNQFHQMGGPDFLVAMTEMLMTGFPVANTGHTFAGLRPDQIAIGMPASVQAGNGFLPVAQVQQALNYLILGQSFGDSYVLRNPAGYHGLRGLMSWSVNWDQFAGFDFSSNERKYLNALPAP